MIINWVSKLYKITDNLIQNSYDQFFKQAIKQESNKNKMPTRVKLFETNQGKLLRMF